MSNQVLPFYYDYTKCMVMKLSMANPDRKNPGKSLVHMTFEEALDCIKAIDAMTEGITKIYYLVGWQYCGHDDRYPDFFEVNKALKRPQDKTARDSLLWLHEAAKAYNSVVSLHINFNDAYEDAPSFETFVQKNALIRDRQGKPHAIERYNGKRCYKTCLKTYWESGLFQKQFDRLLDFLPFLQTCHTVHVDNFQCYHNYHPSVSIREMQEARRKMILYAHEKGIDITSEFTYKEDETLPNRMPFGLSREHHYQTPINTLGLIPLSWWCTRMRRIEYVEIPPEVYCGGIYKDGNYGKYLYGNMHGEDLIHPKEQGWKAKFLHEFATLQVPYHFLCTHRRLSISGHGLTARCVFSDGIVSYRRRQKITWGGDVLKEKDTLFLPVVQRDRVWLAYSATGDRRRWPVKVENADAVEISRLTPNGCEFVREEVVRDGSLFLSLEKGEALLIRFK